MSGQNSRRLQFFLNHLNIKSTKIIQDVEGGDKEEKTNTKGLTSSNPISGTKKPAKQPTQTALLQKQKQQLLLLTKNKKKSQLTSKTAPAILTNILWGSSSTRKRGKEDFLI